MEVDASKGRPETEFVHPVEATDDCDFAYESLVFSIEERFGFKETKASLDSISELLKANVNNQAELAKQVQSTIQTNLAFYHELEAQRIQVRQLLTAQNNYVTRLLQKQSEKLKGGGVN